MKSVLFISALLLLPCFACVGSAAPYGKPQPPIELSIVRSNSAGDTAELLVQVKAFTGFPEVRVTVDVSGGARVVTGETEWRGPLQKGDERRITLFVRPSPEGKGTIRASAELSGGSGRPFLGKAVYRFEGDVNGEKRPQGRPVKGGGGEDVIEFREPRGK